MHQRANRNKQKDEARRVFNSSEHTVISTADIREHTAVLNGQERTDLGLTAAKELEKMKDIYKPYIDQMNRGEKVQIMSEEERIALAEKRIEENKEALKKKTEEYQKSELKAITKKHDKTFRFKKKRGV